MAYVDWKEQKMTKRGEKIPVQNGQDIPVLGIVIVMVPFHAKILYVSSTFSILYRIMYILIKKVFATFVTLRESTFLVTQENMLQNLMRDTSYFILGYINAFLNLLQKDKYLILAALRNREHWNVVLEKVSSVVDEKSIPNEKIKQCKRFRSSGSNFDAVGQLKSYTDKQNELLVYNVDEINGTVFKTSTEKMKIARNMDKDGNHFLNEVFLCFDGKVKRTKNFVSLTVSGNHTLLKKQLTLVTMECLTEDTSNVKIFWELFQQAYKKVNGEGFSFNPSGWSTGMASECVQGIKSVFGRECNITGCEFHYKQSIEKRMKS